MGATAPGFPHAFAGTSRPLDVWIGRLEVEAVSGELAESDYADASNDRRLFAGIVLDFQPRALPGLYFGLVRVELNTLPPEGLSFLDRLLDPYRDVRGNLRTDNGLLSLFGWWVLPESGFEAYVEWGRDDHWQHLEDVLTEPDHSPVYTLGFQKLMRADSHWVRIAAELIHLESAIADRSKRALELEAYWRPAFPVTVGGHGFEASTNSDSGL
jgi:hypothetical protein